MQENHGQAPSRRSGLRTFGMITFITFKWLFIFGVFIGLLVGGVLTGYVAALVKEDEVRPRTVIEEKVGENSTTGFVYFNDATLIGQLRTEEDRIVVEYDELPKTVIDAVLATEDNNFYEHFGVDINGLGRAVKQKLLNEETQTGGSTLTQQLARRVFLSLDKTDSRKVKEIFLAIRMERYLTKEEILAAYLNKVPFGNGSSGYNLYGIKAAAKGIFGISDLNKLTIAQAAYLAGLPQRPSAYTAFTGKGAFDEEGFNLAVERTHNVLARMLETGRINQQQYDEAMTFDLRKSLAKPVEKAYTTYPYLMLEAERQAAEVMLKQKNPNLTTADLRKKENAPLIEEAREHLLRGGYHVYTTIDKSIYKTMRDIGSNDKNFSPFSKEKGLEQIAAVMLNHKTGAILGLLEGRDFYEEQLNYATQMTRQPGSTMKPIAAYLPAIDKGAVQPASIIDDAPIVMKDGVKGFHIPKNANNNYRGLVTAREALDDSLNLPALKIFLDKVGIADAWTFTRKLGITTLQPADDAAQTGVIGGLSIGVSVEELTNAYGSIPNQGVFNDAYMIDRITDANGNVVYEHKASPQRVFSEQTAFLMTDMLRSVITNGTATVVRGNYEKRTSIPIAGKTGSTQDYGDVWFMGFTPDITLGVWSGYEKQVNTLSKKGRLRAQWIWTYIMNQATETKPELFKTKEFTKPSGIIRATVSSASGKLPTSLTREAGMLVTDYFNKKYVPRQSDDALVKMAYVTVNGINYVPNPATPGDMVREQVVIKREMPLDALMDKIQSAQAKLPSKSRRSMSFYLPDDADKDAPSKPDPRQDDGRAPNPPGGARLQSIGAGVVKLTFAKSGDGDVVGYRIYQSVNGGGYQKVGDSILVGDDYARNIQVNGSGYSFYVTAVDVVGKESAPSGLVQFGGPSPIVPSPDGTIAPTPSSPPSSGWPTPPPEGNEGGSGDGQLTAPSTPSGLQVSKVTGGAQLSWQANPIAEQVTGYVIHFSKDGDGRYRKVGTTPETSFFYEANFPAGSYRISAVNASGESQESAKVDIQ
ncbi:transglycosylase domain-containing protein [Paenibacillus sp. GCM10023252]|uniref:transglycosylase domain-containing protein n=1 Tax=Paenibacillus sp. GCM10023252 TaxID=3252649 RepID=UPI00360B94BF